MAYQTSEAYDFTLFEENTEEVGAGPAGTVVPKRENRPGRVSRRNVVELPGRQQKEEQQPQPKVRPKLHPLRLLAVMACLTVIFSTVISTVQSQVELTELTEQINTVAEQLAEAESLEIQLNMQASQRMNGSEVEAYAVGILGMSKITNEQVAYLNVAQEDRGVVVQEIENASFLDSLLEMISSWLG